MKKPVCTIIGLLIAGFTYGQYSIFGKVANRENKPVEFATVMLKKDSLIIAVSLTDSLGKYKISNIKAGDYTILFTYISFDKKEISIHLTKDSLVNMQLLVKSNRLQEVIIIGKKPLVERKMDRIVFNVGNSISSIGANALELLAATPGVRVNTKTISLIGKGGVNVMIDDRPSQLSSDDLMNMLKGMSADDIDRIEIITNPGAQYDAQGNNGLINIVTKRSSKLGYNGATRLGYTQSSYSTVSGGGSLNYNKKKLKCYGNFNADDGSNAALEQFAYFYPTQIWKQVDTRRDYSQSLGGQVGVDYQASKTTAIGISYNGTTAKPDIKENIIAPIYDISQKLDYKIITNANNDRRNHSNAINIHLKQLLDSIGRQGVIDGDWFTYANNNQRTYASTNYFANGQISPNSYAQFFSASKQRINLYTLKADVELPFKIVSFAVGGKLSFINTDNDVSHFQLLNNNYQLDPTQTNQFNYTENIQALYTSASKKIKKWDCQVGLRAEFTETKGVSIANNQINTTSYLELFPTVFATYIKDNKNTFSINFGRRINRPYYDRLNPFRWYLSPYAYVEGNPFLRPSFSNNIELAYTYNSFFTTALSFCKETDRSDQVTFTEGGSNIQATRVQNFLTNYSYQLSNSVVFNTLKWLESTNKLQVYYQIFNSSLPQTPARVQGWSAYVATNNQIMFNQEKTLLGDVNFWYQFPTVESLFSLKSMYSLDIGLKVIMNKKIQIALNATDILKSSQVDAQGVVNQINQQIVNYYDSRQVRISINYKFGNSKIKQDEYHLGNEDERNRLN